MEILGNVESKMQMFRSRVKSTIRRATTKQWISAGYLTNTCCSTGSPIYMGWVHFWDFAVKKIFYRLYGWMHSNLTAPPPPPPPQKNVFRGCKLSCSLLPAKKIYRKRYWLPFALRYIQPSKKTTTKTKQNILREATQLRSLRSKSQKSKVRIAQVSSCTERPAEFTAESSDSENPEGNEDILFQTWCEPENDGRGT